MMLTVLIGDDDVEFRCGHSRTLSFRGSCGDSHVQNKGDRLESIVQAANARLSTGPRTEEGKKRSSLNAFRHGLTGQIVIHTPEDQAAFQKHCDAIRESLTPVGPLETTLAQAIAEDYWRLNRTRALENAVFTLGLQKHSYADGDPNPEVEAALALGGTWTDQARNLQLLTTYEQRIRRSVEKNTAELRALQTQRKAAVAETEEKARLLVQLAEYEAEQGVQLRFLQRLPA